MKYNLKCSPQSIYNIDEKGISAEHKPPYVICDKKLNPQAVTSPRLTVTVIGCGNALGTQIPPYFVFPGKRFQAEYLEGCTPGCSGTVSQTGSGWSNSQIFIDFLKNHFLKFVQSDPDQYKLIIYDGHKSHVNPQVAEWAREHKIILFVLPPHCSHVLQPLDVSCFGPFQNIYNQEAQKFLLKNKGQSIQKSDVAKVASVAYRLALSPSNLTASFRKTGICPFNRHAYDVSKTVPHNVFKSVQNEGEVATGEGAIVSINEFLKDVEQVQAPPPRKRYKTLSRIVSGKAITEDSVFQALVSHVSSRSSSDETAPSTSKIASEMPRPHSLCEHQ